MIMKVALPGTGGLWPPMFGKFAKMSHDGAENGPLSGKFP